MNCSFSDLVVLKDLRGDRPYLLNTPEAGKSYTTSVDATDLRGGCRRDRTVIDICRRACCGRDLSATPPSTRGTLQSMPLERPRPKVTPPKERRAAEPGRKLSKDLKGVEAASGQQDPTIRQGHAIGRAPGKVPHEVSRDAIVRKEMLPYSSGPTSVESRDRGLLAGSVSVEHSQLQPRLSLIFKVGRCVLPGFWCCCGVSA